MQEGGEQVAFEALFGLADSFVARHFDGADETALLDHQVVQVVDLALQPDQREVTAGYLADDDRRDQALQPARYLLGNDRPGAASLPAVDQVVWQAGQVAQLLEDVTPDRKHGRGGVLSQDQTALILDQDAAAGDFGHGVYQTLQPFAFGFKLGKLGVDARTALHQGGALVDQDHQHLALDGINIPFRT